MKLATRMGRLGTETAFEVLVRARALEAQGRDVIHLEIGEPDFDTPRNVIDAGAHALADRLDALWSRGRAARSAQGDRRLSQPLARASSYGPDNIVVTPGGKPIMFFTILALLEAGDEVIYPNPGFPIYESMINFTGATAVPAPIREENGFALDVDELASLITPKTKLLIINCPANPTGGVLNREEIERIAELAVAARSDRAGRRDLQRDPVRRRARFDRDLPGHEGAHDHPRRLLEDLRDDRLAARLRRDAGRFAEVVDQADGQQQLLHLDGGAARRDRGADRPARRCQKDDRRVQGPARSDRGRAERDPGRHLPAAEGRVLRLPEHHRHRV